jgi:hypothetical protein
MKKDYLTLKRASASRPSGEWNENDYDVLADSAVVGRIFKAKCGARRNAVDVDPSLLGQHDPRRGSLPRRRSASSWTPRRFEVTRGYAN